MLVKLRQVRMDAAARALAQAREATARAEAERRAADAAASEADTAHGTARADLTTDLNEAQRLLALVDQARFAAAIAEQTLEVAQTEEQATIDAETAQRRAAIVARARHLGLAEHAAKLGRRLARRTEERAQSDMEDARSRR